MTKLDFRFPGSPPAAAEVELRRLQPGDWDAVEEIYWSGIRNGLASFETETGTWEAWDERYLAGHRLVAEAALGDVIGFGALAAVSRRRAYAGVAEATVYVAEGWRGKGIGHRLLDALVAGSESAGIWTVQASVFPENRASVGLFTSCGFRIVGTRERVGRRDGLWRDTLLLERRSPVVGAEHPRA